MVNIEKDLQMVDVCHGTRGWPWVEPLGPPYAIAIWQEWCSRGMFPHHLEVEFFQLLSICFPNIISQDYISFFGDVQNRQLKSCFLWSFQSEGTDPRLQVRNHHGNSTASRLAVASSLLDLPYGSSFLELESKTTVRQNSGISRNINKYMYMVQSWMNHSCFFPWTGDVFHDSLSINPWSLIHYLIIYPLVI